jgi:DNA (cytosine-5)-methyltransferase 1
MNNYNAIDLFSGCGGLSKGMVKAGFDVKMAIDNNAEAVATYKLNHPHTKILEEDIRKVSLSAVEKKLNNGWLHLLAGCPPCQGFSSVRRLNKKRNAYDQRNSLILEYFRFVRRLRPLTIMLENVPGLIDYYLFKRMTSRLKNIGYHLKYEVVNIKDYEVPQSRRRLVLIGSLLGEINIAECREGKITVRDVIGNLESVDSTEDPLHKIYAKHGKHIQEMIELIPRNGGSRKDLPDRYILDCHKQEAVGFNDIYGRLRWDDYSTTITGGCLNPSKGRFLHPEENRCITAREAALLQSFPKSYKFPVGIAKNSLALLIGNALPPQFSYIQCRNIKEHLDQYLG